jgi:hypothetical protein
MRTSLDRLWLVIAVGLPALVALLVPLPAVDLAYQVRAGAGIIATGALPTADTYTFTVAGAAWTDQQWLAQVLLAAGHNMGGWELLAVLRAALVASCSALVVLVACLRGAPLRAASILSLLAFVVAAPALALRPQLFAVVVFAGMLALVAGRERHPRMFLAAPLLALLWANLHGSFVLAPLLLGYALLDDVARGRPARRSVVVLLLGTAATCVTPFGPAVWAYAAGIGANPVIAGRVSEWQRTSPLTVPGALFYLAAIGAAAASLRGRARLTWADGLWLVGLTALAVWAERGVAWWPSGAVLVVAAALASPVETTVAPEAHRVAAGGQRLVVVTAAVLGIAIVAALPWWRPSDPWTGRVGLLSYAPAGLAQAVADRVPPGGRVAVPQTWGSWFEWAAPGATYFVDSRFELFPADVWADYDAYAAGGSAADAALSRWRADAVVVPATWTAPSGSWTVAYKDDSGELLVRSAP